MKNSFNSDRLKKEIEAHKKEYEYLKNKKDKILYEQIKMNTIESDIKILKRMFQELKEFKNKGE